MSNAPDFSLDAELEATDDWDASEAEPEDDFVSGYADEPDPEDDPTIGAMDLAERYQLRRVAQQIGRAHV